MAFALIVASSWPLEGARASATARPACRSGRTVFRQGAIRAFVLVRHFRGEHGQPSSPFKTFYVCRPGWATPRRIIEGAPFTRETAYQFRLSGPYLGWLDYVEGVQSGSSTEVGWVDLRSGRIRSGLIDASEGLSEPSEEEAGLPRVPVEAVGYAIAPDGTVALIGEGGEPLEWEVCLLAVGRHSLGRPRALYVAKAPAEGLDPASVAITATSVTWTTKKGLPGSAPR